SLAKQDPRIAGIVAYAPLEHGERVASYLQALKEISPLVKGVRRMAQAESDSNFSARPEYIAGARLLEKFGLRCDICIKHWQMPSAIELVRQAPGVRFMLDHLGKPDIKSGVLDPWRAHLAELARLPNVFCKVSGIVTEADHQ